MLIFGWLFFALIVGLLGSSRRIGFWGAFLLSLILSPLIGFIFTLVSRNKEDSHYQKVSQRNMEYQNYVSSRNEFPDSFTVDQLGKNDIEICLDPADIPNSEIGKPISIQGYHVRNGSKIKASSLVVQLQIGDQLIDYFSPNQYQGEIRFIHKKGTYLLPNDTIFIITEIT